MNPLLVVARKDVSALFLSRQGIARMLAVIVFMVTGAMLLSSRGMQPDGYDTVYVMLGMILTLGALQAVIVGTDLIAGEYDRITLLPLLVTPVSREWLVVAKMCTLLAGWGATLCIAVPCLLLSGGAHHLAEYLGMLLLAGTPAVVGFGLLALGLGVRLPYSLASMALGMFIVLAFAMSLIVDPGPNQGTLFYRLNPIACALNIIVDVRDGTSFQEQWPDALLILVWLAGLAVFALRSAYRLGRDGQ